MKKNLRRSISRRRSQRQRLQLVTRLPRHSLNDGGSPATGHFPYGSELPVFAFTCPTSLALIAPLALTSDRKFVASTVWLMRDLVCDTSLAFAVPLALVSPRSRLSGITTSLVVAPSFTQYSV